MKPIRRFPLRNQRQGLNNTSCFYSLLACASVCMCRGGGLYIQHCNISVLNIDQILKKHPSEVRFTITTSSNHVMFHVSLHAFSSDSSAYEWCLERTTRELRAHYIPLCRGHGLHESLWVSWTRPLCCFKSQAYHTFVGSQPEFDLEWISSFQRGLRVKEKCCLLPQNGEMEKLEAA